MRTSSIPSAQLLLQNCKAKEISHIVIAPGSRNAPLIIGFTEDPYFSCYSIVDERCAAFFALGMAQQLKQPVAVLCTSGSALLNFYPAVAEAFYSAIPLIVLSADRPPYKIDIGDGQTIRQDHVFEKHIGYSANLKQDITHATETIRELNPMMIDEHRSLDEQQDQVARYNQQELQKALNMAQQNQLPVHINIPFEEPLYNTLPAPEQLLSFPKQESSLHPVLEELAPYVDHWGSVKRKIVLVGVLPPNSIEQELLDVLARDPSVLVFTETTSNLHHPDFFPSIDSIIAPIEKSAHRAQLFSELQPDILLTFGGLIVSKKVKAFLRKYKPKHHWHINENAAYNTFFCLSHHFQVPAQVFLKAFLSRVPAVDSSYRERWLTVRDHYVQKREGYLKEIPFSDMWVFHAIMKTIPKETMVHLANSSTVRYAQLFDMDPSLPVYCNRGTSGIDGSTSTAIGASLHYSKATLLLTGDLSFFYDSNGLWNRYLRPDFRIIVINNGGGGIFRILPGKEETENFAGFFETTHNLKAKSLCELYELDYHQAGDEPSLNEVLKTFYEPSDKAKLLEIMTPRQLNDKILLAYFDFISSNN